MSHRATVWAYGVRKLSPAAKLVLLKLADCANDEGLCWPSQSRIAEDCGMLRQAVNRVMRALVKENVIAIDERYSDNGSRLVNYYQLSMTPETSRFMDETSGFSPPETYGDTPPETPRFSVEPSVLEPSKEEEDSEAIASGAVAPVDPVKAFWDRALAIVGESNRSFIGGLRKTYGPVIVMEAIVSSEAEKPSEPVAYLVGYCKWRKANAGARTHTNALDILARAAVEHDERQGYRGPVETAH